MKEMLASYHSLWMMTQELVETIQQEDWDETVVIRDRREALLETIKEFHPEDAAEESGRQKIADYIGKTLILEKEIKTLLEEKMSAWQGVLNTKRRVENAYGIRSC